MSKRSEPRYVQMRRATFWLFLAAIVMLLGVIVAGPRMLWIFSKHTTETSELEQITGFAPDTQSLEEYWGDGLTSAAVEHGLIDRILFNPDPEGVDGYLFAAYKDGELKCYVIRTYDGLLVINDKKFRWPWRAFDTRTDEELAQVLSECTSGELACVFAMRDCLSKQEVVAHFAKSRGTRVALESFLSYTTRLEEIKSD